MLSSTSLLILFQQFQFSQHDDGLVIHSMKDIHDMTEIYNHDLVTNFQLPFSLISPKRELQSENVDFLISRNTARSQRNYIKLS